MTGFAGYGVASGRQECGDRFIREPVSPRCDRVIPDTPTTSVELSELSVYESMPKERGEPHVVIDKMAHTKYLSVLRP